MSLYQEKIKALAPYSDPRHIEAWMRLEYKTLDSLSESQFAREVVLAVECIAKSGKEDSERLAKSFGL
jgi:hypothetical protein